MKRRRCLIYEDSWYELGSCPRDKGVVRSAQEQARCEKCPARRSPEKAKAKPVKASTKQKVKQKQGQGLPAASRYWEGWEIIRSNIPPEKVRELSPEERLSLRRSLTFHSKSHESVREKDPATHQKKIKVGDLDYICGLIRESSDNLLDPSLKGQLPLLLRKWSGKSRMGDSEAKKSLDRLNSALKGSRQGRSKRPDKLKDLAKRNFEFFRLIMEKKQGRPDSLEVLIPEVLKEANLYHDIHEDEGCKIYKSHSSVFKKCRKAFMDREAIFVFLEACAEHVDEPCLQVKYKDYLFVKSRKRPDLLPGLSPLCAVKERTW